MQNSSHLRLSRRLIMSQLLSFQISMRHFTQEASETRCSAGTEARSKLISNNPFTEPSQTGGSGDLREAGRIQRFKRGSDPLYQTLNQVSWEDASKFYKKKEYQFGKQFRTIFCVYLTIWHERSPHWMEASLVPNFVESWLQLYSSCSRPPICFSLAAHSMSGTLVCICGGFQDSPVQPSAIFH